MSGGPDVVVVGAGLAGLACALRLRAAGVDVVVHEAGERVGGRVTTDVVDGFRCDVGFQLLNPAYPALRRVLAEQGTDLVALGLRPFGAGAVVVTGRGTERGTEAGTGPDGRRGGGGAGVRRAVVGDPRRLPSATASTLTRTPGSLREKAALLRWVLPAAYGDAHRVRDAARRPDTGWFEALDRAGVRGRLRESVLVPFLAGVLGEDDGSTSAAYVALVLRSFVRGTPGVPAAGVAALPEVLAARLPAGAVRLATPASGPLRGPTAAGALRTARAVVVATDAWTAGELLPGLRVPAPRALTTFWHEAPAAPSGRALLHLDGDRTGPVLNTAVMSAVAPSYAPPGRHLVASTVLGADDGAEVERAVLGQLERIYGASTAGWHRVAAHALPRALPAAAAPLDARRDPDLGGGLFVAGDHRDTPSQQGALTSGRRAADAVLRGLGLRPVRTTPA